MYNKDIKFNTECVLRFNMDTGFNFNETLNATKQSLDLSDSIIFRLYRSAIEVSQEVTDEIEKGIQNSDYHRIKDAAHKLKGASGSIRLDSIYQLSIELENDAKEQKEKDYSIELEKIKKYFSSLEDALKNKETD